MSTMIPRSGGSFYIGLSSTLPTADGKNVNEPVGNNYSRVRVQSFSPVNNGTVYIEDMIEFPTSTGAWFPSRQRVYWVLFDGNDSDAHVLASNALSSSIVVLKNTSVSILAGSIKITLADRT